MDTTESGFCSDCGSILPLLSSSGKVSCYGCERQFGSEAFHAMKSKYVINFNTYSKAKKIKDEGGDLGPVVERKCPKCNNDKMSYATLQLRSADEGQTVFYTCTKCQHKETENS